MPQEGLLVQCDASPHAWLEERGPSCNLHGAIDDATGNVLGLYFRPEEDLVGHLMVLKQMVERHGVPAASRATGKLSSSRRRWFSPAPQELELIICPRHSRKDSNGSTVSYFGRTCQLVTPRGSVVSLRPRGEVTILHLDGSLSARYEGRRYRLREFVAPRPDAPPLTLAGPGHPLVVASQVPLTRSRTASTARRAGPSRRAGRPS